MIISAIRLPKYLASITFPISIYAERGDEIVHPSVDEAYARVLIDECAIIGVGNANHIKRFRVNIGCPAPIREALRERGKELRLPTAADNRTIMIVSRTFTHHPARSAAYAFSTIGCG